MMWNRRNQGKSDYIWPGLRNEFHDIIGYVPLDIDLLLLSWALVSIIHTILYITSKSLKNIQNHYNQLNCTLTTDAPVANFFPSFFEASLSLTPATRFTSCGDRKFKFRSLRKY